MSHKKYEIKQIQSKGLGIFAKQPIQTSTLIQSVSEDEFITYDIVEDFYQFIEVLCDPTICSKVLFSYFLASSEIIGSQHRLEYAHIASYIQQLPRSFHGLIVWEPEQLSNLSNKELVSKLLHKRETIKESFDKIQKAVKQIWKNPQQRGQYRLFSNCHQYEKITLSLILKYYSVIQSRGVFYLSPKCRSECVGALVPIIDKLNHCDMPNSVVEIGSKYSIKALRRIERGEEILVSYGYFNYDTFLEFYGFLPDFQQGQSPSSSVYRQRIIEFYNRTRKHDQIRGKTN